MSLDEKNEAHAEVFYTKFSAPADGAYANQRVKLYPLSDGSYEVGQILTYNNDVFLVPGWEKRGQEKQTKHKKHSSHDIMDDIEDVFGVGLNAPTEENEHNDKSSDRAFRRARNNCYDYIMSNDALNMFVTLTFSKEQVERDSYKAIYDRLRNWLDNRVKRKGLKYILIPEYHSDGENIHLHGLMNEEALNLVKTDIKRKGKRVYNIGDFTLGFTTAIRITGSDSRRAVSRYCFKYMTKSMECGLIGGRYYLHGGKLNVPLYKYYKTDFDKYSGGNELYEMKVGKRLVCYVQKF